MRKLFQKEEIAKDIIIMSKKFNEILSIGCGIGLIAELIVMDCIGLGSFNYRRKS